MSQSRIDQTFMASHDISQDQARGTPERNGPTKDKEGERNVLKRLDGFDRPFVQSEQKKSKPHRLRFFYA